MENIQQEEGMAKSNPNEIERPESDAQGDDKGRKFDLAVGKLDAEHKREKENQECAKNEAGQGGREHDAGESGKKSSNATGKLRAFTDTQAIQGISHQIHTENDRENIEANQGRKKDKANNIKHV